MKLTWIEVLYVLSKIPSERLLDVAFVIYTNEVTGEKIEIDLTPESFIMCKCTECPHMHPAIIIKNQNAVDNSIKHIIEDAHKGDKDV